MSTNDAKPAATAQPGRGRAYAAKHAVAQGIATEDFAALIRELNGDHTLGAGALAEALIDRGVTFRPGRYG
jgi:hypothetical protein